MFRNETLRQFILFILAIIESRWVWGYPGRNNGDGTYTVDIPSKPGYIYVTLSGTNGRTSVAEAINMGSMVNPNLPVRMEYVKGVLVITMPDPRAAARLLGRYASAASIPPGSGFIGSGSEDVVEGRRFLPGLLAPSTPTGLTVQVFPFMTPYGWQAGDAAFAIAAPATSGTRAWVRVAVDTDNTLQYIVGSVEYPDGTTDLDVTLLDAEAPLPLGWIEVGAVVVSNGGTVTVDNQFTDTRHHLAEQVAKNNYTATTDPSVGDDELGGYRAGSEWHNNTAQTLWLCWDASTGAAVWVQITGVGSSTLDVTDGITTVTAVSDLTVSPDFSVSQIATNHAKVSLKTRYLAAYNYRNASVDDHYRIGLAVSADARAFTRLTEPLLDVGAGGSWEDEHLAWPCLVRGPTGVLHLYYAGNDGSQWKIGLARSFDNGETFTKYASNPILSAAAGWESTTAANVLWPRVIYDTEESDSNKVWKMWYGGGQYSAGGVGYAYSPDGITWTKYASNPVLTPGTSGAWDDAGVYPQIVTRLGDTFNLFYGGNDNNASPTNQGGLATFTNPESSYTKSASNPILVSDGITDLIASTVSIGATTITVTDASKFHVGGYVWVFDSDSHYLTKVVAINTATNVLTMADGAPSVITAPADGIVRSIAYNSVNVTSALYDGSWRFWGTAFQPEFIVIEALEVSLQGYAKDLDTIFIDYSAGLTIPVTLAEGQVTGISLENPFVLDLQASFDRFLTDDTVSDENAIHDNIAGEIAAVTAKAIPVGGDYLLIEDSADSNNKKSITIADLPTNTFTGDAYDIDYGATTVGDELDDINTAIAGLGASIYTPPPTTGWTALNSPTTFTTTGNRLYLEGAANATFQVRGEYRNAPSTPYAITVAILPFLPDAIAHCGLFWYDSSGGRLTTWGPSVSGAGTSLLRVWYKWTDFDTLNSNYINANMPGIAITPLWLRIEDDGTNHKVYLLQDNAHPILVSTQTRTDWVATPDKIGIFVAPGTVLPAGMTVLSWVES